MDNQISVSLSHRHITTEIILKLFAWLLTHVTETGVIHNKVHHFGLSEKTFYNVNTLYMSSDMYVFFFF